MIKRSMGLCGLLCLWLVGCQDAATERVAGEILVTDQGVAIEGYDPVAYFQSGGAVLGSVEHSAEWDGATWWFSSAENRNLFVQSPDAYAPVYGGWCAYGMADGYAAETDPVNGWTIHEGKLYLNWDAEITAEWRADKNELLQQSEANWSTVRDELRLGKATVYWHDN